jgi:AraC family transcriptional regulator, L-rhamnose operon regulatory protein RhaS
MKNRPGIQRIEALQGSFSDRRFPDLGNVGWCRYPEAQADTLIRHRHERAWEIAYILRGSMFWDVEGSLFHVEPGQLFLTRPDELHGGENQVMHACELYWFIFRLDPKRGSFGLTPEQTRRLIEQLGERPQRIFSASTEIRAPFERMLEGCAQNDPLLDIRIHSAAQQLICALLSAEPSERRPALSLRMQKVINRIYAHPEEPLSIADLAATAGLKPSYFREQFKKETGHAPSEYQTLLRVQKAAERLRDKTESITDIAYELGFCSSQYFATVFRKTTGMTPRQFRRQITADIFNKNGRMIYAN